MATIEALEHAGDLIDIVVPLEHGQQPERKIYGVPAFIKWLESDLPGIVSDWDLDEDPAQQMDSMLAEFISGGPMTLDRQFKPWVKTSGPGVWYLKTADLRIFGWFARRDCFIAVHGDSASKIKKHNLYFGYVTSVVRVRDAIALDEPKFIPGVEPDAVLSIHA